MKQTDKMLVRKENKGKQGDKPKRKKKRNEKKRPSRKKFNNKWKNEKMVKNKATEQRMEKQEIRNKAGFKNKNEAEVKKKNWQKLNFERSKKRIFEGYGEEGKSWEEGSQEKWDQETGHGQKRGEEKWEKWDQETGYEQEGDGEKKGKNEKRREKIIKVKRRYEKKQEIVEKG